MGSGYNESVSASRSARAFAASRTPIHFYLEVPKYEYDLGCGRNQHLHTFQTRTPLVPIDDEDTLVVWCEGCQEFREIAATTQPMNQPVSNDEAISWEQDKGILRERIALGIQDMGFVQNENEVMQLAVKYGVPVGEIRKLNAGLRAPEGLSGLPDMCKAGLHEMTIDNIDVVGGYRTCKACRREKQRQRRQAKKR